MTTTALSPRTKAEEMLRHPAAIVHLKSVLPATWSEQAKERFITNCQMVARTSASLANVEPKTVMDACIDAARLGLEVNSPLKQAWVLPYGQRAQLVVGYQGLCDLMRRSGLVKAIHTGIVRAGDSYRRTATTFEFECDPFSEDRGPVIGAYCVLVMADGSEQVETMSLEQINHIRAKSRAGTKGPWITDFDQMARKTVLRRAANLVSWSPDDAAGLAIADETEFREVPAEVEIMDPKKGVARVRARLAADEAEEAAQEAQGAAQYPEEVSEGPQEPETRQEAPQAPRTETATGGQIPTGIFPAIMQRARQFAELSGLAPWTRFSGGRQALVAEASQHYRNRLDLWDDLTKWWGSLPGELRQEIGDLEDAIARFMTDGGDSLPGMSS